MSNKCLHSFSEGVSLAEVIQSRYSMLCIALLHNDPAFFLGFLGLTPFDLRSLSVKQADFTVLNMCPGKTLDIQA